MRTFASRRWRNLLVLLSFSILCFIIYKAYSLSLHLTGFLTGWTLFLVIIALAFYNLRKRLPFLPLLSSSDWLQFHIYAGLVTFVLFTLHTEFRIPNGGIELFLTFLYLLVMGSGIVGWFLSRAVPRMLTTRGEEVLYERIPVFRRLIRKELDALMSTYVSETNSVTLVDFYARQLVPFFEREKNLVWHLIQSNRPRYALLNELDALRRYLSPEELEKADEISELIITKDDLDYQYAHQSILKYWLFVHIPLTYSLLLMSLFHALVAYAFVGGF